VITAGTVLRGRYVVEEARPGEAGVWVALDRQLRRRVMIVALGAGDPAQVARERRRYQGRVLDAGSHEGDAYLVVHASEAAFTATVPGRPSGPVPPPAGLVPPAAGPSATRPRPPSGSGPPPPLPGPADRPAGARPAAAAPVWAADGADATAVQPRPVSPYATAVQPRPVSPYAADAPPAGAYAVRDGAAVPASRSWALRSGALAIVAFMLGAGVVVALAILASPAPRRDVPPAVADQGAAVDAEPTRTLPPETAPIVTTTTTPVVATTFPPPVAVPDPAATEPAPVTEAPPPAPAPPPRPRPTRRRRGWFW
jgi:hypothetical protein